MRYSHILFGIISGQRLKNGTADHLYYHRGVVLVVLDVLQLEEIERDLIVNQLPIGGTFRIKRLSGRTTSSGKLFEVFSPFFVKRFLIFHESEAHVIEQPIQFNHLSVPVSVLVITDLGSRAW